MTGEGILGIGILALALAIGGYAGAIRATQPETNTVTIHKTQDRLPVACQEGAQ
jgi:hypothetical protein